MTFVNNIFADKSSSTKATYHNLFYSHKSNTLTWYMVLRRLLWCKLELNSLWKLRRCLCWPSWACPGPPHCMSSSPSQSAEFWPSWRSFLSLSGYHLCSTPRTSSHTGRRPRKEWGRCTQSWSPSWRWWIFSSLWAWGIRGQRKRHIT